MFSTTRTPNEPAQDTFWGCFWGGKPQKQIPLADAQKMAAHEGKKHTAKLVPAPKPNLISGFFDTIEQMMSDLSKDPNPKGEDWDRPNPYYNLHKK
jgi:hypothetical protein